MSKIFISYRRDDSAGYAHAIYRELAQSFSKDQPFMDVDAVEPGADFVRVIEEAVGKCDVLVALIGKRWVGDKPSRRSRLDNEKDYVRLEVSYGPGTRYTRNSGAGVCAAILTSAFLVEWSHRVSILLREEMKNCVWLKPELVAPSGFTEWTSRVS
jgi:TIR domain